VEKIEGMHEQDTLGIYAFEQKSLDIDESVFDVWKTELERTLPSFWQSMRT
jgi:hypothetical protein